MHPLTITTPLNIDSAIAAHASDPSAAFIAGGTDLIGLMKDRAVMPARLLDINALPGMAGTISGPWVHNVCIVAPLGTWDGRSLGTTTSGPRSARAACSSNAAFALDLT